MNEILQWLVDTVQSVDPVTRTLLAGLAIILETSVLVGLIIPGDTVVIVASLGVETVPQGVALALTVIVGSLIGESIGFALGRWVGPKLRHSWVGRRVGEHNWVRAEIYLHRRGGIAIFLSRFLPVLHSLVPLTVGMSTFQYRRFLAWTIPACTLWAAVYVGIASLAAGSFRELADQAHYAGYVFVGIIVAFLLVNLIVKKIISRREQHHMDVDAQDAPHGMTD